MIGTWQLVRLALRRDRILLPVWVLCLVGVTYSTTTALEELYDDAGVTRAARRHRERELGVPRAARPAARLRRRSAAW